MGDGQYVAHMKFTIVGSNDAEAPITEIFHIYTTVGDISDEHLLSNRQVGHAQFAIDSVE